MRGKKTVINTIFSLLQEVVAVVCAFILPKLILSAFGSKYNGLTTSITQFLACAVLLRSGIGGATRAALYKPLAHKNKDEINSIVKATDIFMKKVGLILATAILIFSLIYPVFVLEDFGYFFSFSLFLIIGLSTFAESFFGITYLIVLQADQKLWIASLMKSICYILNTVVAAVLILNGCNIHIVKLGSAFVFVLYPIILQLYVKKKYKIDGHVAPNNKAISQRWDAFWHQVAIFVMNNTDVIVLTTFSNMLEVSVYSVYNLIINGLKRAIASFTNGLEAAFGNMIAKEEKQALSENVAIIEIIIYSISTFVYTVGILVILQFVSLYTKGIEDVNYLRPTFAYILLVAQFFNGIRIPYQMVVQAAGHYKQTKRGAMIEPIINIVVSVVFVIFFGIVGVAIGTLAATIFRTIQYSMYANKKIIGRKQIVTYVKILVSIAEAIVIIVITKLLQLKGATTYYEWTINSIIISIVAICIIGIANGIIYTKDAKNLIKKIKNIFKRKGELK